VQVVARVDSAWLQRLALTGTRFISAYCQRLRLTYNKVPSSFAFNLNFHHYRKGLKEYSNWPTYPQVYAGGELVVGSGRNC
jgi:glutaredoxin-related protein